MFFEQCRKHLMIVAGLAVMVLGLILMPVPGPGGTPVFLAGLAILSTEFKWARNFLAKFKNAYGRMGKTKRRIVTASVLVFYLVSGAIAWSWANQPERNKITAESGNV